MAGYLQLFRFRYPTVRQRVSVIRQMSMTSAYRYCVLGQSIFEWDCVTSRWQEGRRPGANAKDHLSFSSGVHACLGARLARIEAAFACKHCSNDSPTFSSSEHQHHADWPPWTVSAASPLVCLRSGRTTERSPTRPAVGIYARIEYVGLPGKPSDIAKGGVLQQYRDHRSICKTSMCQGARGTRRVCVQPDAHQRSRTATPRPVQARRGAERNNATPGRSVGWPQYGARVADPSILQIIGGGAVGASLAYALSWWRERRRTKDAYRAPQREAIGGIIAATHELLLAETDFRQAISELANDARGQLARKFTDEQLDTVTREFNRTALGVDRAFQVGRLTIVEAACYEKMGVAYNRFVQIKNAFGDVLGNQTVDNLDVATSRMNDYARQLNRDVADLVLVSHTRVSPVQSVRNRFLRRGVRRRLEAKFFQESEIRKVPGPQTPEVNAANVKIYVDGWIEYQVDDAQALLESTDIRNAEYPAEMLAPNALMFVTSHGYKRENYSTAGATVVSEELCYSSFPPEQRQ
jgi:hypothetical protein